MYCPLKLGRPSQVLNDTTPRSGTAKPADKFQQLGENEMG